MREDIGPAPVGLDEAEAALLEESVGWWSSFLGAFTILLREGLEALLVVVAMIAFLRKAERQDVMVYVHGGWIVALLVVAEPLKRLGRFTFADALNSRFQSPGIRLAAGVSALVVSVFYLIPQMVGAGALVPPRLRPSALRSSSWMPSRS